MAPINFENNLKEKLEKRRLKPSTEAWNTLSERLDNRDKKNNKKPYWWLGLAASIVGVLFIISQFLNNETKVNNAPILVDTPEAIQQSEANSVVVENDGLFEDVERDQVKPKKETIIKIETQKSVNTKKDQEFVASVNERKMVSKEKTSSVVIAELPKKALTFEEQKIQDVVSHVLIMKEQNKVVTDADIDLLLKEAQKEIIHNRLFNEATGVVDANALLQDVEAALDQSFRSKVFDALKSSYNSVKTAVAQRND